jgi:hypothetical protein
MADSGYPLACSRLNSDRRRWLSFRARRPAYSGTWIGRKRYHGPSPGPHRHPWRPIHASDRQGHDLQRQRRAEKRPARAVKRGGACNRQQDHHLALPGRRISAACVSRLIWRVPVSVASPQCKVSQSCRWASRRPRPDWREACTRDASLVQLVGPGRWTVRRHERVNTCAELAATGRVHPSVPGRVSAQRFLFHAAGTNGR